MNRRTRRLAGGATALGAGAILIGPITALAQSDDDPPASTSPAPTDDPSEAPADERPDVASRLAEVLQPLVDAGTISQAQLDAVTQALQDAGPVWGGGHGGPRSDHGRGPGGFGGRLALATAAETIGITADELRTALEDGQTLAEVATANGVEPQAVIDALVAEATTRLDEAVADGRIEQADADARLAELAERITTSVEEGFPTRDRAGREAGEDETAADDEPTTSEAPTTTTADG